MLEQQNNETLTPVGLQPGNGEMITHALQGQLVCDSVRIPHLVDPIYTPLSESAVTAEGGVHA